MWKNFAQCISCTNYYPIHVFIPTFKSMMSNFQNQSYICMLWARITLCIHIIAWHISQQCDYQASVWTPNYIIYIRKPKENKNENIEVLAKKIFKLIAKAMVEVPFLRFSGNIILNVKLSTYFFRFFLKLTSSMEFAHPQEKKYIASYNNNDRLTPMFDRLLYYQNILF